jgi:hypothetical protein
MDINRFELLDRLREALKPSDDLDKAVSEFAYLFFELADYIADMNNYRVKLKDKYDLAYAETKVQLLGGSEKMTVSLADTKCEIDPHVQKALRRLRKCDATLEKLTALMKSFEKKSSMLKAEVELVVNAYTQRDSIKPRTRKLEK